MEKNINLIFTTEKAYWLIETRVYYYADKDERIYGTYFELSIDKKFITIILNLCERFSFDYEKKELYKNKSVIKSSLWGSTLTNSDTKLKSINVYKTELTNLFIDHGKGMKKQIEKMLYNIVQSNLEKHIETKN